jgi:NADH-ubiquinone oxidoreductase chain 5
LLTSFTKSAQFPFSSWLPKAISAPTPVSALVHSRTLVTAGLFLLIKFSLILNYFNLIVVVFIVGLLTMVIASVCALFDPDFKKVIALRTLSQLGFLMISLGLGNIFLSFFHLISHACFKSCLFIQIGFIIHSFYSQQDRRGYNSRGAVSLLVQLQTLLCLFCLSGLIFTSGFVSKDFILEFFYSVSSEGVLLRILFFFGVFLTFLYRIRLGLAMVKMHTYSLNYIIKRELFIFLSFPLILFSLFLL